MRDTTVAIYWARARIAVGAAAILAPRLTARIIGGRRGPNDVAPLFARMLGGRDIALGLGTVIALDRGKPVRGWCEASALADTVDCVSTLLAGKHLSPAVTRATAGSAAASALLGVVLSRQLDPPPPPLPGQPEAVATGHPAEPGPIH